MAATLAALKKRAKALGLVVEDDVEAGTLYVETVPGEIFREGTHYFAEFHDNDRGWRQDAIASMLERLDGDRKHLIEECSDPECDWCCEEEVEDV